MAYGGMVPFHESEPSLLLSFQGMMIGASHHVKPSQESFFSEHKIRIHCLFPQFKNNRFWEPVQLQVTPQFTVEFQEEKDLACDGIIRVTLPLGQLCSLLSDTHIGVWGSVQKGAAFEGKQKLWNKLYFKVNGQVTRLWSDKEKIQEERKFCFFWGVHWENAQAAELLDLLQDTMALNWKPLYDLRISPAPDFEALKRNLEVQLSKISSAWNAEFAGEIQSLDKVSPELLMPPDLIEAYYEEYLKENIEVIEALSEISLERYNQLHQRPRLSKDLDVLNQEQFQEIERLTQIQYNATEKKEKREKLSNERHALQNLQANLNKAYRELAPKFLDLCCELSSLEFSKSFPNQVMEADFEKIQSELQEVSKAIQSLKSQLKKSDGNRASELDPQPLKLFQQYLKRNLKFVDNLSKRLSYSTNTLELMKRGHAILESFFKTTQALHPYWADYASKWRTKAANILERLSLHSGSTRFQQWQQLNSQSFRRSEMQINDKVHIKEYEGENYVHLIECFPGYPFKILEKTFMHRFMALFQLIQQELKDLKKKRTPEAFSEIIKSVSAQDPEGWTKYKDLLKNKIFLAPIQELKEFIQPQLENIKKCRNLSSSGKPLYEIIDEDEFRIKWLKLYGITPKRNSFAEDKRRELSNLESHYYQIIENGIVIYDQLHSAKSRLYGITSKRNSYAKDIHDIRSWWSV